MANVLLGVTGSVAAVKTPALCAELRRMGHQVKVAPTHAALAFFDPSSLQPGTLPQWGEPLEVRGQATVYLDSDEWPAGRLFEVGEPVLHIELRKWADVLLIAPLDANTLAKLALGLCDNLLTCVYRAWDLSRPVALAPAMNTLMWEHPATTRHLGQLLEDFGGSRSLPHLSPEAMCDTINTLCTQLRVVKPVSKRLACGDEGVGGLASVQEIAAVVSELIGG
jgi:phosphopantothenoylcysteine decarboxylase